MKFVLAFLLMTTGAVAEVRQSTSGVCHCVGGTYYNRLSTYTVFLNLESCLETGKEPKTGQGHCQTDGIQYSREYFGGWIDSDKDCMDTRQEILSRDAERFQVENCKVVSGLWYDPYSGFPMGNPYDMDVDHVVPLSFSWDRGSRYWQPSQRVQFANDPDNLLVTDKSLNRSKGDKGILEWLPPVNKCEYTTHFILVLQKYNLEVKPEEIELSNDLCR